jgi:acetoin utilization deacetylase AcuC-like enzyme
MKFVYSDRYLVDIGPHVFPVQKYSMVREALLAEGVPEGDFIEPVRARDEDLLLVHSEEYLDDLVKLRRTHRTVSSELPLTREIIDSYILAAGGTCTAVERALEDGCSVHLGGGWHHAFRSHAEGFCYVNDIAVALKRAQKDGLIHRAAVVDCDLHQGNGTAKLFQSDSTVFTFSIHQERNYPVKETSDLDIGLEDRTGDEEYNSLLGAALQQILGRSEPELVIYVAGSDPYEKDLLGGLSLTIDGLYRRDELVMRECDKRSVPVAVVFAGGYSERVEDTVEIHLNTCRAARAIFG